MEDIENIAKQALDKDEIYEFLCGKNGYGIPVLDAPVDVPTDWTRVIPYGIYSLYEKNNNNEIIKKYQEAIIKMINTSAFEIWCAMNVIFFQLNREKKEKAPFKINQSILHILYERVIEKQEELKKIFPEGKNSSYNAYEDILRLNSNYYRKWNEQIIPIR